jgi:hypothetical protein
MTDKYLILFFLILPLDLAAQRSALSGRVFKNTHEPSIYKYTSEFVVTFWMNDDLKTVDIDTACYGFFDSCELTNVQLLNQDGAYYYEVDKYEYDNEETREIALHSCSQLFFFYKRRIYLQRLTSAANSNIVRTER